MEPEGEMQLVKYQLGMRKYKSTRRHASRTEGRLNSLPPRDFSVFEGTPEAPVTDPFHVQE